MDIFPAGKNAVAIYIDNDELAHIAPHGQISAAAAADILKSAVGENSDFCLENICIELYPGHDSTLLFARIQFGKPQYFCFDSAEPVILAAKASPPGITSHLCCLDGNYILTVYPPNSDTEYSPFLEYGYPLDRPDGFAAHLTEHGRFIAGPHALDTLRDSF